MKYIYRGFVELIEGLSVVFFIWYEKVSIVLLIYFLLCYNVVIIFF